MPRVSVVIPVYNGAATVAAAIESALSQHFEDAFEVIAVNDGSTDSTPAVLASFGDRIIVVTRQNGGLSAARNSGVAIARGEFVAFLDADDVWMPERLAVTVAALDAHPAAVMSYSDAIQTDENGATLAESVVTPALARAPAMADLFERWWPILPSTILVRRSIYDRLGGFVSEMRSYEDMDFWLRARELGEFVYVPRALVVYRVSPSSDRLVKYEQSYDLFVRRVTARYGRAARPMLRAVRHAHSTALGFRGLAAMRNGDMRAARRSFIRALRFEPAATKMILRLMRTFLPRPIARMLTGRTRGAPLD